MGNTLYICNEDISKNTKATASALADAGTQITIGDLHGSTIKLLFVLAKHGFVTFTDEQYRELHTIYMIDQPIFENFMRFNEILHSLKFNKTNAVLRLIGDDLADRGQCDWLTINVIAVMRLRGIKLEILASNHGMDFMLASECDNAYQPYLLSEDTSSSMVKLHQLIKNGVLNENDVKNIWISPISQS